MLFIEFSKNISYWIKDKKIYLKILSIENGNALWFPTVVGVKYGGLIPFCAAANGNNGKGGMLKKGLNKNGLGIGGRFGGKVAEGGGDGIPILAE